jgi:hypothetical protein
MPDETSINANANGGAGNTGTVETRLPPGESLTDALDKLPAHDRLPAHAPRKGGDVDAKLLGAIQESQEEFLRYLTRSPGTRGRWPSLSRSNPELLQVYGVIYDHLCEAQRLLTARASDPAGDADRIGQRLHTLLGKSRTHVTNVHAAWALAGSLGHMLLLLGDDNYIIARLEAEREREQKKLPGSWTEYLAVETLDDLLQKYKPGDATGQRARAVESLALLYARRSAYMRTLRAGEEIKADYLNRLTFVLTLLLLLLLETVYLASSEAAGARLSGSVLGHLWTLVTLNFKLDFADPNVKNALVAAMTGAVGSTLSGFYKLRDATGGIPTLRSFRSAMRAQPFVGATAGVLLMLLIKSGVVAIGDVGGAEASNWLRLAVFCFFAGFSEPFFLGVVQRVAGAADKKTQGAAEGSAAAAAGKAGEVKK